MKFEWDRQKAVQNEAKHDVSFDESATVFLDPFALTIYDEVHSVDEERFISIGMSEKNRIIVVVYTERGNTTRIISSRRANQNERRIYESNF